MKILMVARRYPPDVRSGTETVFSNLYAQARQRHDVRLVVGYRVARDMVPPEAVAVDLRGQGATAYARMAWAAAAEARRFKPDVVLSNSIEIHVPDVPNAVIVHDLNFGKASRSWGTLARERFYAFRGRHARIIAVSEATRQALVRIGIPEPVVIRNGVDIERFQPVPSAPSDGRVHFVYPSRILQGKGQHVAIDAIARLRADYKRQSHLTIVGAVADKIYADQLRIQAFNQPVDFALDVPDIVPYYQNADVVVFPTIMEEGFGFTAVEGMACGKPVIWSDQPAIREATGGIGLPIKPDDAESLRAAMLKLLLDPALREKLGAEGRAWVEQAGWAKVWLHYEEVLRQLCS